MLKTFYELNVDVKPGDSRNKPGIIPGICLTPAQAGVNIKFHLTYSPSLLLSKWLPQAKQPRVLCDACHWPEASFREMCHPLKVEDLLLIG